MKYNVRLCCPVEVGSDEAESSDSPEDEEDGDMETGSLADSERDEKARRMTSRRKKKR